MLISGFKSGSHHGTFLLVRMGICVRVKGDVWAILIAFHGNDGHGGQTPSVTPSGAAQIKKIIAEVWNGTPPPNRCGFVAYFPWAATTRAASYAVSPALGFMNQGAPVPHKETYLNFSEHGAPLKLLGDLHSFHNRLNREAVYHMWNLHQYTKANSTGGFDITQTLPHMTYVDELGVTRHCDPVPFHPITHVDYIEEMQGRFQWLWDVVYIYSLGVTKTAMKEARERRAHEGVQTGTSFSGTLNSHMPNQWPTFYLSNWPQSDGERLLEDINEASVTGHNAGTTSGDGLPTLTPSIGNQESTTGGAAVVGNPQSTQPLQSKPIKKRKRALKDVGDSDNDDTEEETTGDDDEEQSGEEYEIEKIVDYRIHQVTHSFIFYLIED